MRLTEKDIKWINSNVKDCWNEGIFTEPNWIPSDIKEPVIYMRWVSSGYNGGNCYGDSAEHFSSDKPRFTVLDMILKKIKPEVTYLEYKEIESLIKTSDGSIHEYYGNSENYEVEYIVLSELYDLLKV